MTQDNVTATTAEAVVIAAVITELSRADRNHGPMASAHEGYAIVFEEMDELWDHVKTRQRDRDLTAMRKEAVQIAAMAIKFVRDVCDGGKG